MLTVCHNVVNHEVSACVSRVLHCCVAVYDFAEMQACLLVGNERLILVRVNTAPGADPVHGKDVAKREAGGREKN